MQTTRSADGTTIAYDTAGAGPPLVLVDGALCTRTLGPGKGLSRLLAEHFTVITYDRRGRGDSGDGDAYAVEREVEDLAAVVGTAGDGVVLFGQSSGAVLALDAALRLPQVTRLAVYEAPFVVDGSRAPTGPAYREQLTALLARGERGRAVRLFLELVGLPAIVVRAMGLTPLWPRLKAIAHTLPYDAEITAGYQQGTPLALRRWAGLRQPTLVLDGGDSPPWMRNGMHALAELLPDATHHTLTGQTHNLRPKAVAPELVRFFDHAG